MRKRKVEALQQTGEKVLDVNASMQGTLRFDDPVNLRINGKFEGTLDTKGMLMVGERPVSGDPSDALTSHEYDRVVLIRSSPRAIHRRMRPSAAHRHAFHRRADTRQTGRHPLP